MGRMGQRVQDALDAIEYANGPPEAPSRLRRVGFQVRMALTTLPLTSVSRKSRPWKR